MELAPPRHNVELRTGRDGVREVVFAFPYRADIVDAVRGIPGRRFDWDVKEWWAPADELTAVHVAAVLDRFPELTLTDDVAGWIGAVERRWLGFVTTARHDGRGWFVCETRGGELPPELAAQSHEHGSAQRLPLTTEIAEALTDLPGARLDGRATGCAIRLRVDTDPPPAALVLEHGVNGRRLRLDVLWDPETGAAFAKLPGVDARARSLPIDPYVTQALDRFLDDHGVEVTAMAEPVIDALRRENAEAQTAITASRAQTAQPIDIAAVLGGELAPFQHAGVRYALEARRTFLGDEQGLGKTVQALAALEADGAFPAAVVCPAGLKLNWEREVGRWLPGRRVAVLQGRAGGGWERTGAQEAEIVVLNYEVVEAHRERLAARGLRAIVFDESHYCKEPRAKRTKACIDLGGRVAEGGLRLALTGTPIVNRPRELISQLRLLDRLADFGSGAGLSRRFCGPESLERLHWHLRAHCYVRRVKVDVLPQLPPKRQETVVLGLDNEAEYRLAEEDVIAWLQSQPLDLRTLEAKVAAALRAEQLVRLNHLRQLVARGKLSAALPWIHDFTATGEPLVVFAEHRDVQQAVVERFPGALHVLGSDSPVERDAAVSRFQDPT
ncbi:MAG: SNF2-related protein, partial [Actinomycetota bacterium]|nr:SNF2-related protein [Actinomycetota bacterium]